MRSAAAYMSSMSSKSSARPSAIACWRRFESCPPGISWWYTRPVGDGEPGLERAVQVAHGLPVRLEVADRLQVEAGVALGVRERGDQCRQRRLARGARHRRGRGIDGIHARRAGGQQRRELSARGVVRVHVHRQVEVLAQRRDEPGGRGRPQETGHVLDRQDVRAGLDDLLGETEVVVERVEPLRRVEQVGGVAERHLGDRGARRAHGVDRRTHLRHVVERVEDAEDVDAGRRGLAHERVGDLDRARGVAHRVAAAQQHLDRDVRHAPRGAPRGAPTGLPPRKRSATS